jgi:flavin reductase (DIM6/NTAB) family NADH-FMN oxidoreductase RutF
MRFDPSQVSSQGMYQLLIGLVTPRPIAWITTVSPNGITNLAPFSFFNAITARPPTLIFSCANRRDGSKKDTIRNIEAVPEFVVNVCSYEQREAINNTSAELDYEVDELATFGLTAIASETVKPPRVAGTKAQFECVVHQIVVVGEGSLAANLVIGRITMIHAEDEIFDDRGAVDPGKLDTIGRLGGSNYARTTDRFSLDRPTRTGK